ncbi:hypothetical protein CTA1_10804 [Colletotrichum tanaceti]|uniref:Uncharacterized protein n=1 Tax=Colletotrichum tanaceti TaxID=1306861 RepID=A0A4U6XH82_9PEZI|nr:hypothetical protein CTA1_10804 [Colletotrichum tanaceti]
MAKAYPHHPAVPAPAVVLPDTPESFLLHCGSRKSPDFAARPQLCLPGLKGSAGNCPVPPAFAQLFAEQQCTSEGRLWNPITPLLTCNFAHGGHRKL